MIIIQYLLIVNNFASFAKTLCVLCGKKRFNRKVRKGLRKVRNAKGYELIFLKSKRL